ncbi:MAG: 3'-5' exonuclease domain-containing protein 2 [Dysgonamonadaceae bacterium]|nr:3'-5' exonuclease domain-containing protein 2 [Dysgonamonadaceae bacterium]
MGLTISKEDISKLPLETFDGNIVVIDHGREVAKAVDYLSAQSIIGFDTETRPTFTSGKSNKVALLQLSTEDTCFLFRLNLIGYPDALKDIICNSSVKKIGLSLRDDFAAMRKRTGLTPENFIDLQVFADKFGIDDNSLQRIYAIIFGKKISKTQRLSNWEAPQLSYSQLTYAALDAWACLRIYNHLMNGSQINGTI